VAFNRVIFLNISWARAAKLPSYYFNLDCLSPEPL
jgi:hypothetical protein